MYSTIQYIRYRLKAKTRHGVHSPFVYGFIEQVLLHKVVSPDSDMTTEIVGSLETLYHKYRGMLLLIARYCEPPTIYVTAVNDTATIDSWVDKVRDEDVVYVHSIHSTKANTTAWQTLCNDKRVKLSIDLHYAGVLFFRKEFKEKQHFVLRY